uniref:Transposase Tc1-like domain-containing protein n=1 Tax=Gadus morhua TaxID=8049 RepID=A0A8C4ZZL8_GADMO
MKNLPNLFCHCQTGYFAVAIDTCFELLFHLTGAVKDRLRSGRPMKTTPQEDRFITLSALRSRRLSSADLQSRFAGRYETIRNRIHTANLRSHRAARNPAMTALHRQAHLRWCRQHMHWNLNMWRKVMFSDESRFCLRQLDHRVNER